MADQGEAEGPRAEPVSALAPRPVRHVMSAQTWRDVVFLHWAYDAGEVAHLLPAGTRPDVHDGRTWVGVVGLCMDRVTLSRLPPVPRLSTFGEVNVRLYAVGPAGRRSTVFRAMEAARLPFAAAARASLRLPYAWSAVQVSRAAGLIGYRTRRLMPGPRGAGIRFRVRVGGRRAPTSTELFCTARWGLHARWYGRRLYLPVEHEEWPLHDAQLVEYADDGLLGAAGVADPGRPPDNVLYAPRVHARLGPPLGG